MSYIFRAVGLLSLIVTVYCCIFHIIPSVCDITTAETKDTANRKELIGIEQDYDDVLLDPYSILVALDSMKGVQFKSALGFSQFGDVQGNIITLDNIEDAKYITDGINYVQFVGSVTNKKKLNKDLLQCGVFVKEIEYKSNTVFITFPIGEQITADLTDFSLNAVEKSEISVKEEVVVSTEYLE